MFLERTHILRDRDARMLIFLSILGYIAAAYLMMVSANYASSLSPKDAQKLPDKILESIVKIEKLWITDAVITAMIIPSLIYIVFLDANPVVSVLRLCLSLIIAYLLRSLSMIVTSFPDPRPSCEQVTKNFFTTFTFHRCGDCMFSGHTTILVLFLLWWIFLDVHQWTRTKTLMILWSFGCFLFGIWSIMANHAHYSVDVLVAIYVCVGIWFGVLYGLERWVPRRWSGLLASKFHSLDVESPKLI